MRVIFLGISHYRFGYAGTSPLAQRDETLRGQLRIGFDDGWPRNSQLPRKVACRGKERSRFQGTTADRLADMVLDLPD
jgi:hypothetical protein